MTDFTDKLGREPVELTQKGTRKTNIYLELGWTLIHIVNTSYSLRHPPGTGANAGEPFVARGAQYVMARYNGETPDGAAVETVIRKREREPRAERAAAPLPPLPIVEDRSLEQRIADHDAPGPPRG